MSGYAYSRQGKDCPTELEWANHQGEIANLVEIEDDCFNPTSNSTPDSSNEIDEIANGDNAAESTDGQQNSDDEIIVESNDETSERNDDTSDTAPIPEFDGTTENVQTRTKG